MEQLRYLKPFVVRYRVRLFFGTLCAFCSAAMIAAIPQILRVAVDGLNSHGVIPDELLRYGLLMIGLALCDSLFRFGQRMLVTGTSYLVEYDMRSMLFRRLLTLDQYFYGKMHTGDLMARVTNDLSAVRQLLGPGINSMTNALFFLVLAGGLLLATNLMLALIVLLLLPIITVLFIVIGARMRKIFRSVQDQFGSLSTRAQESFSGIRTIKAYAQEDAEIREFYLANERYRSLNVRYVLLSGVLWPLITLIMGVIGALVLLVGGYLINTGAMTLGDLVLFNSYLAMLAWPMIALGWTVNLYQQAAASLSRIREVTQTETKIISAPDALPHINIQGAIEFRHVAIRFDHTITSRGEQGDHVTSVAGEWVLRDISFVVPQGSSLAIVGATGSGKTTLVSLLARVRDPDEGQVLIDGHDLRTLTLDDVRRSIGYVVQDTFLFSVPLRENITFGRSDATDEMIDHAVAMARLSNDLPQFPQGLDTLIGERGVTLSGGQKQRTAIARAVLRDPAILVLDDALSSIDTHTAAEILANLRTVMRGRTSIIIAQRIATVKDADQIIVLHDGVIVERGTHRELVDRGGHYTAMYRRELLQAEMEEE